MIRKYAATGKEITREDDACLNADGTVTLCEQVASNMTYMVSKTPLSAPHSKRLKVSFDIQGGAAHYEGNAPPMRVGFLLGGKNAVTWNSSWTYTDFVFKDWLYGFAFNWDLTTGQGHFVASRLSVDTIAGDGVRTGPTMSWVSRGDNSRNNQNQKMDVDLIYDPVGRVSGIFSTRAKSASQNSQCTRVDWSVPEAYLPHLEYWKANRAPYVGIRVASGNGNYTGMRLDGMRVQRMDAAEAGRLPGTLRVPAGASATLAAGEAMAGQDTRVVTVAEVELGAAASLTVSPATNNATIVGVESVTAFGAGTLATAPGASVAVEKVSLAGTAGQSSLTVTGGVTFPAALSVTIPDAWLDSPDRLVVVDAAGAAGQFSSAVSIVTESGADVTDRAHLSVRGGIVSIGFANGTVIIVR